MSDETNVKATVSVETIKDRRTAVKWRDTYAHKSSRACGECRHYTSAHRFCEKNLFLSLRGCTCRQFSKPKEKLRTKKKST